jgi:hypothetical protein
MATTVACGDRVRTSDGALPATIDTIGDTIRVRTERGAAPVLTLTPDSRITNVEGNPDYELGRVAAIVEGPAGGIYLWDESLSELRLYDSTGTLVRRLGRKGQGPGEYTDAAGIAAVNAGDVALWDPQTARFTVFAPDGTVRTSWRWQSSLIFAPHALYTDTAGNIHVPTLLPPPKGSTDMDAARFAAVRVRPDGGVIDTIVMPAEKPVPMLRAQRGGTSTGEVLPFAEQSVAAPTPWGTIATTLPGRYAIDIPLAGSRILRVERDIEQLPVQDAERRDRAEEITRDMRKVDPSWRWSGPEIPHTKPFIRAIIFAADDRLWVQRSMPAERRESSDTTPGAPDEWIEPTTYDIFERDGHLLGEVTLPASTKLHLALGDRIWAVQRDSIDIPTVVRFKLTRPR